VSTARFELASDPRVVQLFHASRGEVEGCPGCLLIERLEKGVRVAYFVERVATCALVREDVATIDEGSFREEYFVQIGLKPSGRKSLERCAARRGRMAGIPARFLVVVAGDPVEIESIEPGALAVGLFPLLGDPALMRVGEALRP
jgi:hypothetical protein